MGNTPASKTRCFCVLLVLHAAQVLSRTVTLALLSSTQPWWAAVYLGGDFLVYVIYKAARRDLMCWVTGVGVPVSLLIRFAIKVFTDSTACVQFRNPFDLGGLYYILNAVLGQAIPLRTRRAAALVPVRHPRFDPCCMCRSRRSDRSRSTRRSTWARRSSRQL